MADKYGLRVVNSTLKIQLDSTYEMFGMYVKSQAIGSQVTNIDYYNDVIAVKMPGIPDPGQIFIAPSWSEDRTSLMFHNVGANLPTAQIFPRANLDYLHLSRIKDDTTNYPEDYGLQVKTPTNGVAFDSRALRSSVRPVYASLYPSLVFKAWSNKLPNRPGSASAITEDASEYISIMGGYIGAPGSAPISGLTFASGIRFVKSILDTYDQQVKTGGFHDTTEMLGANTQGPNLSSFTVIKDYQ